MLAPASAPARAGAWTALTAAYEAAKPSRTLANAITTAAGAFVAALAAGVFDWPRIALAFLASALVVAGACTLNNYLDRALDARMPRTAKRALPARILPPALVLAEGVVLAVLGFALSLLLGMLAFAALAAGFIIYLAAYGPLKRVSIESALVGSIAGAMPIVAGYVAIARVLDARVLVLGIILVAWQMAHFYAIALYRLDDYAQGGIPTLPAVKGARFTRIAIMGYCVIFLAAMLAMGVLGEGILYLAAMALMGIGWIVQGAVTPFSASPARWGQAMFRYSLLAILGVSIALPLGFLLP
ncbi:MAG TPA: protoheme IX farnesyltransferase [Candidatus Paceibacterota bacterium]|nr:protoheme IX farnesyltransferase [Candidatus Paceibacterota bacterium]